MPCYSIHLKLEDTHLHVRLANMNEPVVTLVLLMLISLILRRKDLLGDPRIQFSPPRFYGKATHDIQHWR